MAKLIGIPLSDRVERYTVRIPGITCWLWGGAIGSRGYGVLSFRGKDLGSHRAAYESHYGPIPKGMFVCHECDNPWCVRPDHLFLGTANDNMQDKVRKNRQWKGDPASNLMKKQYVEGSRKKVYGEKHHMAKLPDSVREAIRKEALSAKIPQAEIAKKYGISQAHVSLIKSGKIGGYCGMA